MKFAIGRGAVRNVAGIIRCYNSIGAERPDVLARLSQELQKQLDEEFDNGAIEVGEYDLLKQMNACYYLLFVRGDVIYEESDPKIEKSETV